MKLIFKVTFSSILHFFFYYRHFVILECKLYDDSLYEIQCCYKYLTVISIFPFTLSILIIAIYPPILSCVHIFFSHSGDIKWGTWSDWEDCDVSCGKGTERRERECVVPDYCFGDCSDLPGGTEETRFCDAGCCPGKFKSVNGISITHAVLL